MANHRCAWVCVVAATCFGLPLSCGAQQAVNGTSSSLDSVTPEMRGDLLMAHKQYQAAVEAYRSSSERSAVLWTKIGVAYHHLYDINDAKAAYEHALELKPDDPNALNNLGAVYFAQKQLKLAERLYRRAIKLKPQDVTVRKNLGTAYFTQGNFHKGMEAYRAAFAIDPNAFNHDSPHLIPESASAGERINENYCLAALYAHAGMTDRAIEFLRKAIEEGFKDYKRLNSDEEFASLRNTPEFTQLMKEEGRN